ncbi:MAG TPA: CoA transferase [Longimicrobiales bacterium]|nr:CoA transferase [Longimicrobiales bacterium]
MTMSTAPLSGVRVLELAQNLAGPYAALILADLGADVVKIEQPGGDAARAWGPPFVGDAGAIFAIANRGKRSIELDITTEAGADTLRQLIARTDIVIEAFRPGALERMGFGYGAVHAWNETVIYCSVLAYGTEGPLRELPGYDPLMQAHAGMMSNTGDARPARVGTSVVDMGTGMWLAIAVLTALRERAATGAGTQLSVALYDTALAWNAYHLAATVDTGYVPAPMGTEMPMIAPYGAFPTADGELMIAAANDVLFRRLCTALSLHELLQDQRLSTNPSRVTQRAELNRIISAATARYATAALIAVLRDAGVPCAPIQDMAEVVRDEQTRASGMIVSDEGGTTLRLPIRFGGSRPDAGTPAPAAGAHTAQLLDELKSVVRDRR